MLKSMNVVAKNGLFLRTFHRTLTSSQIISSKDLIKSSGSQPLTQDEVSLQLKSATDSVQVLNFVSTHSNLNSNLIMQSLNSIFQLQKSGTSSLTSSQLLQHPEFEDICRSLKKVCRNLTLNDVIAALKVFSYLGVPSTSKIMLILLSLVRHHVNELTLGHLVFLDFLLRKFEKTPLVEALRIALPVIFAVQLPVQIDHEDVKELSECMVFVARNHVPEQTVNSLITALTLHGEDLTAAQASTIVRGLSDMHYTPKQDKLITNCLDILTRKLDDLEFNTIDSTLTKVTEKVSGTSRVYFHESFLNKCAECAVQNDPESVQKAFYFLKKFNRISFVNYELLNYVIDHCVKQPKVLETAGAGFLITFVTALSNANYITADWELLNEQVMKNPIFTNQKIELPWMKFALEYMSLGGWHEGLIERLFSDVFLQRYFSREYTKIDYLLLLQLYQAVRILKPEYRGAYPSQMYLDNAIALQLVNTVPLEDSLRYLYGTAVLSRVKTKFGHFIDHVIQFDAETLKAVDASEQPESRDDVLLEDLLCDTSKKLVAISMPPKTTCVMNMPNKLKGIFELRIRTLEAMVPTAVMFHNTWNSLADFEKLPYLEQLVNEKLK